MVDHIFMKNSIYIPACRFFLIKKYAKNDESSDPRRDVRQRVDLRLERVDGVALVEVHFEGLLVPLDGELHHPHLPQLGPSSNCADSSD